MRFSTKKIIGFISILIGTNWGTNWYSPIYQYIAQNGHPNRQCYRQGNFTLWIKSDSE